MAVLPFLPASSPVLLSPAARIENARVPEAALLAKDLLDTLSASGGIGLAAPQIGIPMRAIAIRIPAMRVTDKELDLPSTPQVLFNPQFEAIGTQQTLEWEGCLSLPGIKARVSRHAHIRYTALAADGRVVAREVTGFHARVIQHEIDHLDGILMIRRVEFTHADVVDMNNLSRISANDDLAPQRLNIAKAGEL